MCCAPKALGGVSQKAEPVELSVEAVASSESVFFQVGDKYKVDDAGSDLRVFPPLEHDEVVSCVLAKRRAALWIRCPTATHEGLRDFAKLER
jgi:hypothetical protein